MTKPPAEVTEILRAWNRGDRRALDKLIPVVEDELRRIARRQFRRERKDHTLQPTALVNEAYLRLVDQTGIEWHDRAHFFGIAARIMRQILVDHARRKKAGKRGGSITLVDFDEAIDWPKEQRIDLGALDEALDDLARLDPRQALVEELRFFGGMTIEETAKALEISPATVKREWTTARAWLFHELSPRS